MSRKGKQKNKVSGSEIQIWVQNSTWSFQSYSEKHIAVTFFTTRNENKMLKNKTTKTPPCADLDFTTKQNKLACWWPVQTLRVQWTELGAGLGGWEAYKRWGLCQATTSFLAHSSLLTKKERARKQDQTWGWAEEREVFGENQVNQGGSQNEESLRIKETYYLEARCTDWFDVSLKITLSPSSSPGY